MRRYLFALGLFGGFAGADVAVAQDCIQDQYGRVICGQRVRPYYAPEPRYYQPAPPPPPYYQQREHYRSGGFDNEDRRYSPPSNRWKTFNGCPPNYTVQDGLCKPYSGR